MPGLVLNFALMRNSQLIANLKRRAYLRHNPTNRTNTKNQRITIIAGQEYPTIVEAKAKSAQLNISAYAHRCLEYYDDKSTKAPTNILQERHSQPGPSANRKRRTTGHERPADRTLTVYSRSVATAPSSNRKPLSSGTSAISQDSLSLVVPTVEGILVTPL